MTLDSWIYPRRFPLLQTIYRTGKTECQIQFERGPRAPETKQCPVCKCAGTITDKDGKKHGCGGKGRIS